MPSPLPRAITAEEIETYQRDGIVCLRGLFDAEWITLLRDSIEADKANPSGLVKSINEDGATGNFFSDTFIWHHIDGFKRARVRFTRCGDCGNANGCEQDQCDL